MMDPLFAFLAQNSSDVLWRVGNDGVVQYVSPSVQRLMGYTPEEIVGQRASFGVHEEDLPGLLAAIRSHYEQDGPLAPHTLRLRRRDGAIVWAETQPTMMRDDSGRPTGTALIMRDVTERKLLEQRLAELASTDGLTGLANRRNFDDVLEREWQRTLREGSHMSLILLDIDHFKKLNDEHGHQMGDDCLRAIARVLEGTTRATDLAARYGGEEFAVVLPGADASAAQAIAEDILRHIQQLGIPHTGNPCGCVTASAGVATALARIGGRMRMPESLLQAADAALYRAKHGGRNRYECSLLMAPRAA